MSEPGTPPLRSPSAHPSPNLTPSRQPSLKSSHSSYTEEAQVAAPSSPSATPTPTAPLPSPAPRVHVRSAHTRPKAARNQRPATASAAEGAFHARQALLPTMEASDEPQIQAQIHPEATPQENQNDDLGEPVHVEPPSPTSAYDGTQGLGSSASWPLINMESGLGTSNVASPMPLPFDTIPPIHVTGDSPTVRMIDHARTLPTSSRPTTAGGDTSDWPAFLAAYAMGRWDPNRTPSIPVPASSWTARERERALLTGPTSAPTTAIHGPPRRGPGPPVTYPGPGAGGLLRRSASSGPAPISSPASVSSAGAGMSDSPTSGSSGASGSTVISTSSAPTSVASTPTLARTSAMGAALPFPLQHPQPQQSSLAIRRGTVAPDLSSPPPLPGPLPGALRSGSEPPHPPPAPCRPLPTRPTTFSSHSPISTPIPSPSLASATITATMRWAGSNVDVAPLSLPSPEHELVDPLRGFTVAIPGTHDLAPASRMARAGSFWEGTQDIAPQLRTPGTPPIGGVPLTTIDASPSGTPSDEQPPSSPSPPGMSYFPRRTSIPPASAPLPHVSAREAAGDYFSERALPPTRLMHAASRLRHAISPAGSSEGTPSPATTVHTSSTDAASHALNPTPALTRRATDPSVLPPDSGIPANTLALLPLPDRRTKEERSYAELKYLVAPPPPDEEERRKALYRFNVMHTARDVNFDRIAHLSKLVFKTKVVFVSLIDATEQWFKSESGMGLPNVPRHASFCAHCLLQRDGEPMVILDALKDWRFQNNPLVVGHPHARFYASAPLRTHDGYNIGSLCVVDDVPWAEFTPRQRHTLKEFAAIVMREMELWRDKIQLRIRDRIQTSMEHFTRECLEMDANDGESMNRVYDRAAKLVKRTLDVEGALVIDISHLEMLDTTDEQGRPTVMYHGDPYTGGGSPPSPRSATGGSTASGQSSSAVLLRRHEFGPIPGLPVLGASETGPPPAQRTRGLSSSEHMKLSDFLSSYPDGRTYEVVVPACFRHMVPSNIQHAMIVPVWNIDRNCFVLLFAYTTDRSKHYLEGYELQYLRAIGVIILSAMLKRRMILADKAKSHFISNISHELRTPLHGILAAAELLADTRLSAMQSSFLHTVQACATSLVETVNHVLDFTKLSGSKAGGAPEQPMRHGVIDLVTLVEETAENCFIGQQARAMSEIGSVYSPPSLTGATADNDASMQREKWLRVETVVDVGLRKKGWNVSIEKGGIRRVLTNLIGNSLKFTSDGFVQVSLRELPDGADPGMIRVELAVNDSGKGISKDFLKNQLFHPFSQENPMQTGTGLGLAIVNSIVRSESVNGKVDVWSVEGEGTEIRVSFDAELVTSDLDDQVGGGLDVLGSASVSLLGFREDHKGQALQLEVLKTYLVDWWDFALTEDGEELGDILVINEDINILRELVRKKDLSRPVTMISSVRGDQRLSAVIDAYERMGGFCHIVFKPGGPSRYLRALKSCLNEIDGRRRGKSVTRSISENVIPSRDARGSSIVDARGIESMDTVEDEPASLDAMVDAFSALKTKPASTPLRPRFGRSRTDSGDVRFAQELGPPTRPESSLSNEELRSSSSLHVDDDPLSDLPDSPGSTVSLPNGGVIKRSIAIAAPVTTRKARVLVIEDNPINRRVLSSYLQKRGHQYVEAVDGQDGVERFAEHPALHFDVVLVDMSMPRLDGCETTVAIRKVELSRRGGRPERETKSTIFALTGLATADDKRNAFNAGVDGYLVKPVSLKSLDEIFTKLGFS